MFTMDMLQKLQQNPQMMEQLVNSPIDPNAVMKYQMGGPSPELASVHMGTQNPSVPQDPVVAGAPPVSPDAWTGLGQMGLGMMSPKQQQPVPQAGASIVGGAPKAPRPAMMGASVRPTRQQGLDEMLASFKK